MSSTHISLELRQQIAERDHHLCSYCRTAEKIVGGEFTIDHILPESLNGATEVHNLCLACWRCNLIKGNRIVGSHPLSGALERFYHPAEQQWTDHFVWMEAGLFIRGLTPTGRAKVHALRLNRPKLIESRRLWITVGWHPPQDAPYE